MWITKLRKEIVLSWLILLFDFLLSLGFSFPAFAGIQVTPTVTQLNLSTGEEKSDFFSVLNGGNKLVCVEVELEELLRSQIDTEGIRVDSWLEVEPKKFDINPGEIKKVRYKIKVPPGCKGELRAQIFFATKGPSMGGIGIRNRFGVAVYVAIKGTEVVEAEITDVSISGLSPESEKNPEGGIKIRVTVQNKGNVHLRPRGKVIIKDEEGEVVKELTLPYGYPIMPKMSHAYYASWEDGKLSHRRYKAIVFIQYGDIYNRDKSYAIQTPFSIK